nr:RICIN domain-containing protein [Candidatus Dependentiae bacterium]
EYKEDGNIYFYNEKGKVIKTLEKGFKKGVLYVQDGGQVIFTNNSEAEILWNTDMQKMEDTKRRIFGPRGMGLYLEAGDAMYPGDELPSVWGDVGDALDKGKPINKGKSRLHFQMDGNLVMKSYYDEAKQRDADGNSAVSSTEISYWETKTAGRGAKVVIMKNGNLVVVDKNNTIIWQANTSGYPHALFTITDKGSILMRDFLGNMLASGKYPTIVVDKNQPAEKPSDLEKAIDTAKQIKEAAMLIKESWKSPEGTAKAIVAIYGQKNNALPPAPEFKVVTRDVSEELLPLKETTPRQGDYYKLTPKQEKAKQAAIDAVNAISSLEPMLIMTSDKEKIANAKKLVDAAIAEGVKESEISYSIKAILDSLEKAVVQLETYLEEESKKTPLPAELKTDKKYYLKTKHSNMYLRVSDKNVVQSYFPDNGTPGNEYKFVLESDGNGYFWLRNAHENAYIGVLNISSKSAGAEMNLWNKEDSDNYKWSVISAGNGYYKLKMKHSNLFMNVSGGNSKDGSKVVQWSADGSGNNEQFMFEDAEVSKTTTAPVPTPTPLPTSAPAPKPTASAASSATPVNLALGKTATSSSNENSVNTADKAFDGNTGTRWASIGGRDPQWLMVDLGAEAVISKVSLSWEAAAGKNYQIQVSNDGNNWTDVASVNDGTSNHKRELTINNAKGRYVRMYGTQRANSWYGYSIWEFEIWGVFTGVAQESSKSSPQTPAQTSADEGKPVNGNYYKIQAKHSGLLISVDNSATNNGANVSQQPDNNLNSQIWKLEDMGSGYFKIVNKNSGKCLDVAGGSRNDGGNIHQWDYANGDNQVWKFEEAGAGYYKIIPKHINKTVDVSGGSKNIGANIQQWSHNTGDGQKWKLIEVK